MNLRARNLGLIFLSALTLFSCEEEISTIGLPPENNLGIFFADIPLGDKATQLWVDKVRSGNTGIMLAGKYLDPDLGPIEAKNFSEIVLTTGRYDTILSNAIFDSLVYSLRVAGLTGISVEDQQQSLEVYQLQDTIGDQRRFNSAFTSSSQALASKVGEHQFIVYPDSVNLTFDESNFNLNTKSDSLFRNKFFDNESVYIYRHNIKLDDSFGQIFFNQAKLGTSFNDSDAFARYFKGLAVLPEQTNTAIIEYFTNGSSLTLFYTKGGKSQSIAFNVSTTRSYNNISPNSENSWINDKLTGIELYEPFDVEGDNLYLQSGTNLMLNIDLSSFRKFKDTVNTAIIQSAELMLGTNEISSFLEPNSRVSMGLTSLDSLENETYYVDPLVNNQNTNVMTFDENIPGYTVDVPLFVENLTSDEVEYDQLTLFLGSSNSSIAVPTSSEVKKVVFNKDDLKLRIYYTTPDRNN